MARQVTYRCRDVGYGVEEGVAIGHWGEHQWQGSRAFHVLDDSVDTDGAGNIYLFPDEVVEDVEVDAPAPAPRVVEVALTTNELHAAEAELETALRRMPAAWRETHHGRQVERAMLTMRAVRLLAARHGVER